MILNNNNNQGVFLELLVAAKNIIKYFTSLKHKIFSLIFQNLMHEKRDKKLRFLLSRVTNQCLQIYL